MGVEAIDDFLVPEEVPVLGGDVFEVGGFGHGFGALEDGDFPVGQVDGFDMVVEGDVGADVMACAFEGVVPGCDDALGDGIEAGDIAAQFAHALADGALAIEGDGLVWGDVDGGGAEMEGGGV